MFHSPGPRLMLSVCVKHLGWTGTKGGAAVWSPEVFSLAVECFQCGTLSVWTFKGKRLFQKQESATNNMATHGPCCMELLPPPPAWHRRRLLLPVAKREYTQLTVCVFVCNSRTSSISQRRKFDCADVAYVSHSFLITAS